MKKQTTIFDSFFANLFKFVFSLSLIVILLLTYSSSEINISWHKKKNSLISDISEMGDSAISAYSNLAKIINGAK